MLQNINLEEGKGLGKRTVPENLSLMYEITLFSLGYLQPSINKPFSFLGLLCLIDVIFVDIFIICRQNC